MSLKVYTNGTDTVVAESIDDVPAAWEFSSGADFAVECNDLAEWREIRDDKVMRITEETDSEPYYRAVSKTAREWAEWNGRGLLCSTEY